ncbi:TPA: hypothetical protein ACHVGM_001236 [Streptococcus suis]
MNGLQFLFEAGIFSRQVTVQEPHADTVPVAISSTKKPLGLAE